MVWQRHSSSCRLPVGPSSVALFVVAVRVLLAPKCALQPVPQQQRRAPPQRVKLGREPRAVAHRAVPPHERGGRRVGQPAQAAARRRREGRAEAAPRHVAAVVEHARASVCHTSCAASSSAGTGSRGGCARGSCCPAGRPAHARVRVRACARGVCLAGGGEPAGAALYTCACIHASPSWRGGGSCSGRPSPCGRCR
eukprot:scaffold48187_cov62-Phaeocystis_antarctica.AAC.2